jgi:hypothetical protein
METIKGREEDYKGGVELRGVWATVKTASNITERVSS